MFVSLIALVLCTHNSAAVSNIKIVLERQVGESRLFLYQGSTVEASPVIVEEEREGFRHFSGGNRHTDVFALEYSSVEQGGSCRVIWMKADVTTLIPLANHPAMGQEMRLNVQDITEHDGLFWVLYSMQGEITIDVVEADQKLAKTISSLPMFKQVVPGATDGRLCTSGKFVVRDEMLIAELELADLDRRKEQWRISQASAEQIGVSASQPNPDDLR